MHLFLVDSHSFGIHSIIPLLSLLLTLVFQMKIKIPASLVLYQVGLVASVVSPLELVSQELQEMKETVNSVQGSLITSVSLIQGLI